MVLILVKLKMHWSRKSNYFVGLVLFTVEQISAVIMPQSIILKTRQSQWKDVLLSKLCKIKFHIHVTILFKISFQIKLEVYWLKKLWLLKNNVENGLPNMTKWTQEIRIWSRLGIMYLLNTFEYMTPYWNT